MLFFEVAIASGVKPSSTNGLMFLRQQMVVELVDPRPVIDGFAVLDASPCRAHRGRCRGIGCSGSRVRRWRFELRLAVVANQRAGIIRADRQIEEAIDRTLCVFHVDDDLARGSLSGLRMSRRDGRDREEHRRRE